jgi:fido (protein-threonine AMPylation protein)
VPELLIGFLGWWRRLHLSLRSAPKERIVSALTEFHYRFLSIHPFLDANGRIARILLDQAAHELLNQRIGKEFVSDPTLYFAALHSADQGDLQPLKSLISASLQ